MLTGRFRRPSPICMDMLNLFVTGYAGHQQANELAITVEGVCWLATLCVANTKGGSMAADLLTERFQRTSATCMTVSRFVRLATQVTNQADELATVCGGRVLAGHLVGMTIAKGMTTAADLLAAVSESGGGAPPSQPQDGQEDLQDPLHR